MPVELTESAKKKLPAALAAKKKREKAGSLGNIKRTQKRKKSRLDQIMSQVQQPSRKKK